MQLGGSKEGGWMYTQLERESKMEISDYAVAHASFVLAYSKDDLALSFIRAVSARTIGCTICLS
jgi:hypothetical protein